MTWPVFLKIAHILGTVLGLGGAIFAELLVMKAFADDDKVDEKESSFLRIAFSMIRLGTILLIISGFGYLLYYRLNDLTHLLYLERFWVKIAITLIITVNALLIQTRKMPLWLGSSISLTSWSTAMILGAWRGLEASFLEIMAVYFIAIFAMALVLEYLKAGFRKK